MQLPFETLKQILRQIRTPETLNAHPWTHSLFVQEAVVDSPQLRAVAPGQQLLGAIAHLFPDMQPSTPPRRGKRLDPHWGQFGLLAALYFGPYTNGMVIPSSFLDAWGRIDDAILHFVFGTPPETLHDEEIQKYRLVGDEVEFGSVSTLSDWHKKGLQDLTEIILNRERFLSREQVKSSAILNPEQAEPAETSGSSRTHNAHRNRRIWLPLTLVLLLALGLGAAKLWRIYKSGMQVYDDLTAVQSQLTAPIEMETVNALLPRLGTLRTDLDSFKREARPLLWLAPRLDWVPVFGNDLAASPKLIELAEHLLDTAILSGEAARPVLKEFDSPTSALDPAGMTALLVQAQPQLEETRQELDIALAVRAQIDAEGLSPRLQSFVTKRLDPVLKLADEGLSLALALPNLVGAGSDGPKTYLLLAQNEDELRPTGGFVTSVGNLVLHNGEIISLDFESVDNDVQEDWSKPYPAAPWQLQQYMDSRVLLLRDASWYTDFPTSASWAEYLYAYTHSHSVDGVIAFDQQFLVMLLGELGPLEVEDSPDPLTTQNVIEYMRQSKTPSEEEMKSATWYRKEFISKIADALLRKITAGGQDWRGLAAVLTRALEERHLLLQLDDPTFASFIAEQGWDNAVRPDGGDYVMVTDANIGFNKTSAVLDVSLAYDVDLNDLEAPESTLTVFHRNNATPNIPCIHWNTGEITGEESYPINRCYWTYLRVYKQSGVTLLDATPRAIPGDWMLLGEDVPARVDELDEELTYAQGFGTLLVVPGGTYFSTSFHFALPGTTLSTVDGSDQWRYFLRIQKQPGTLAIPVTIRIHLPSHATVDAISRDAIVEGQDLLVESNLETDMEFEVTFTRR